VSDKQPPLEAKEGVRKSGVESYTENSVVSRPHANSMGLWNSTNPRLHRFRRNAGTGCILSQTWAQTQGTSAGDPWNWRYSIRNRPLVRDPIL